MKKPLLGIMERSSVISKVLLLLALMLMLTLLFIGLYLVLSGGSQSTASLKVMQVLQTFGTFMLPCFIAVSLWSREPLKWLQLNKGLHWQEALVAVLLMLCASPFINLLASLNEQLVLPSFLSGLEELIKQQEEAANILTERFIQADDIGILFVNILIMALLPAFSEELCFRGTLQKLFAGKNTHIAVWTSAIIFSAIHFQFYGFIPRMLLGALFGYMLLWSGSLWLPVLAHFTNNCIAVLTYNILYMNGRNVEDVDAFGTGDTLWIGILSAIVTSAMIYLLFRISTKYKMSLLDNE